MKKIVLLLAFVGIVFVIWHWHAQNPRRTESQKTKEKIIAEPAELIPLKEKCSDTVRMTMIPNDYVGKMDSEDAKKELKKREAQFMTELKVFGQGKAIKPEIEYGKENLPQVELRFVKHEKNRTQSVYPKSVTLKMCPPYNMYPTDFQNQFSGFLLMNPGLYRDHVPMRPYKTSAARLFLVDEDAEIVKKHDLLHGFTSLLLDTDYDVYLDFDEENPDFDDLWHRIHTPAKAEPNELFVYEIDVSRGGDDPETRDWKGFEVEIGKKYHDNIAYVWFLPPWDKKQYGILKAGEDGIYRMGKGPSYVGTKIAVVSEEELMFFSVVKKDERLVLPRDADYNYKTADHFMCEFTIPLPVVDPKKYPTEKIIALALFHAPGEDLPLFGLRATDAEIAKDSISGSFKTVEGEYDARLVIKVDLGRESPTRVDIPLGMVKVEKNKPLIFPRKTYDIPKDVLEELKYQQQQAHNKNDEN